MNRTRRKTCAGAAVLALATMLPGVATAGSVRLHAAGGRLLDGDGREVILRGIAVIKKDAPFLPNVGAADFARIRSWGMNSIRLGTSWNAIESVKGIYDADYLDRFAALARAATDAGLYVVIDMHQDLWGVPYSNGAPEWAAQTTCPHVDLASIGGAWALNYFSPAVMCAFTNFWTSDDLQAHYAGAWRALAGRLAGNPRIAGYDLMNEPYQGFIPPGAFENGFLYPAQARWLAAIRTVDPDHVGFIEPPNYKNAHMPTMPALQPPANTTYAPHVYGFWDEVPGTGAGARAPLAEQNMRHSMREAQIMGLPLWFGEFGIVHNAPGAGEFLRGVYDLADEARAGTAYWEYKPGNAYSPIDGNGTPRAILTEIARAYPSAVPGLLSFTFDAATSDLRAQWDRSGEAVFAAPALRYPGGPDIVTDGTPAWDETTGELRITGGTFVRVAVRAAL